MKIWHPVFKTPKNAQIQQHACINYHLFSYMFRRLFCHLQGELFYMLKSIVTFCNHKMAQKAPEHVGDKVIIHVFCCICALCWCIKDRIYEKMHAMEIFKKMWNVCKIMNQMDEVPFLRSLACWVTCMKHATEF